MTSASVFVNLAGDAEPCPKPVEMERAVPRNPVKTVQLTADLAAL